MAQGLLFIRGSAPLGQLMSFCDVPVCLIKQKLIQTQNHTVHPVCG